MKSGHSGQPMGNLSCGTVGAPEERDEVVNQGTPYPVPLQPLRDRFGLGLITGEMRPGNPVGTPVKLTACSDAGRFSLLHLPPMHLQYPCGADAECLIQLVAATGFLPSMPSA